MNFKSKIKKSMLSFLCLGGLLSCSGEPNFKDEPRPVNLSLDLSCKDRLASFWESYQQGKASAAQVNTSFKCLDDILAYVPQRIKGQVQEVYSRAELSRILNAFIFKREPKSQEFYAHLLELKRDFFGGSAEELRFSELKKMQSFLKRTQRLALQVRQDVPVLLLKKGASEPAFRAERAGLVTTWFKDLLFQTTHPISLSALDFVLKDVLGDRPLSRFKGLLNLLRGKSFEESSLQHGDKLSLVSVFQDYYRLLLDFNFSLEQKWEQDRSQFEVLMKNADRLLQRFRISISSQRYQSILKEDLVELLGFLDQGIFDQPLSKKVKEHTVFVFLNKYFPSQNGDLDLIAYDQLLTAWHEFKGFLEQSKAVEGYIGKGFPIRVEGEGLFGLFTQGRWPSLIGKDRVYFLPDHGGQEVEFAFQGLLYAAWTHVFGRIMVEAYAADTSLGLTLYEVKEAYLDIFVFFKEIGFLGEGSEGSWFRIFNEGNLFVPSAKPDKVVSIAEMSEYFGYMLSAFFRGKRLSSFLQNECPELKKNCSYTLLRNKPMQAFPDMPGLLDFFNPDLAQDSFVRWKESFDYIAKKENNEKAYKPSQWFRGLVGVQYVEVLYRKYDVDHTDTLSFEEAEEAYKDFKLALKLLPQVKGTAAEKDDNLLRAFFTYFVRYGKQPKVKNGLPSRKFLKYYLKCGVTKKKSCAFESERSSIMAIFSYLTSIGLEE